MVRGLFSPAPAIQVSHPVNAAVLNFSLIILCLNKTVNKRATPHYLVSHVNEESFEVLRVHQRSSRLPAEIERLRRTGLELPASKTS
jgi:hypothetical protein